ncbi:BgTH12-07240 [Blumeria graminis f. sp. triticale]|uniref:DASH complex subunit DUO1 n=4 Tax=Blumeria graminis TaxID=34373 RepID=A0A656KIR9_BLUGR|nr:DASH complex subunit Duo1 [Blumeria graminis f. sp. tritici 96224]CAD6506314.1 BgTH12-07240 [Blumeria graminis f. sp. triticale]VDB95069.1 Bgt-3751 [Blumeria graminis f. sp. tritici]
MSDIEESQFSEYEDEELQEIILGQHNNESNLGNSSASKDQNKRPRCGNEEARDSLLQKELENVRGINKVIENVVSSLECAKGNMDTVSRTVKSASSLLDTWIRILSQAEHNQRLILNPGWEGASADLAAIETESIMRAQAQERKAAEEEKRLEEAKRKAEEEERHRQVGTSTRSVRGAWSKPRGSGRGSTGSSGIPSEKSESSARGLYNGRLRTSTTRGPGRSRGRARGSY